MPADTNIFHLRRAGLAGLRRDSAASITYIGIVLVVLVIMFCGFAVDLMRVETKRVALQGALDSGVLAAADAEQTRDRAQVVRDYLAVAGFEDYLEHDPDTSSGVSATAAAYMRPMFWHNAFGDDGIVFRASSQAVNKKAEVSLVLDISYSMASPAYDAYGRRTRYSKIQLMRRAAVRFLNILLTPDLRDEVSVSIVPYSGQANLGPYIFDSLRTDEVHRRSFCVDLPAAAYSQTGLDLTRSYPQVPHVQFFPNRENGYYHDTYYNDTRTDMDYPICPSRAVEQITAFSQDLPALRRQIWNLRPHGGTSIHIGLHWGAFLLDPDAAAVRNAMQADGALDRAFVNRPLQYDPASILKAIVLMTDGRNDGSARRPLPQLYDTQAERDYFARVNYGWYFDQYSGRNQGWVYYTDLIESASYANRMMANICDAAKARGIVIYAVAVEVDEGYDGPMRSCATSPSHFFAVNGAEMGRVFAAIAQDIRVLRLVQ